MIEPLLSRPVVVGIAVLGAALSVGAAVLGASGKLSAAQARWLNHAGYAAMGVSMLLFVVAGLRAPA